MRIARNGRWDEGLFARDLDGRLIRYDKATREELDKEVKLEIDGEDVGVKKAVPATDEQGNPKYDDDGQVIPRPTTIYDAVTRATRSGEPWVWHRMHPSAETAAAEERVPANRAGRVQNPIPMLCHTPYMDPVAVCRVCVVQLARFRRATGKIEVDDKLFPACQHRVEEEMIVNTIASPDATVRGSGSRARSKTLVELLMSDHPSPCAKSSNPRASASWKRWPARST